MTKNINIQGIINKIMLPINKNQRFYLSIIVLFSISILFIEYGRCSRMRAGLEMFADVYFLCVIITILPVKLRKPIKYIVFGLLYVIGLVDMVCYQIMGTALVPAVVQTWLQTNIQEATEVLHTYLKPSLLFSPIALFFILPLFVYFIKGKTLNLHRYLLFLLFVLTLTSAVYGINNKRYLHNIYTRVSDDDMEEFVDNGLSMTHEYLPIYRLGLSIKEIQRFSEMRNRLLTNVKNTRVDSCSFESPIIVLIIGESYNRHHSSLYGYDIRTTPYQEYLYKEKNLYSFKNVIASYNLTFKSFQNMMTLYDYDSKGQWYNYPILPALFKRAGYKVNFISNQYTLDKASAFTDYTEDVFMNNPEITSYMFDWRNEKSYSYDMDLINDYLSVPDTIGTMPQFVIFHFIGMHADFRSRYPTEQAVFSAANYHRTDLNNEEKQVLADYDNAVVYNDYVINNIIDVFSQKDAIVIHVPDHGELVYDGCQEMGRNQKLQRKYIIPQYDIPFWIYCSNTYKKEHPAICRQIENATERPFMTDDLPHLLLYLAGIKCKWYQRERNLIDNSYNSTRKRFIRGEIDYDKL
ncbi:MAG: phosphoethanolamine transferase [Prevotella sp.]|nr:phosphoethanolamine transferase [Prevotella sp.]